MYTLIQAQHICSLGTIKLAISQGVADWDPRNNSIYPVQQCSASNACPVLGHANKNVALTAVH